MGYKFDADEKYYLFYHHISASDDDKIIRLRKKFGNDAYAWYFIVLEIIYASYEPKLRYTPDILELLAKRIMIPAEKIKKITTFAASLGLISYEEYKKNRTVTSTAIKYWFEMRNRDIGSYSPKEIKPTKSQQLYLTPKEETKIKVVPKPKGNTLYDQIDRMIWMYDQRAATTPERAIVANWIRNYGEEQVEFWLAISKQYLGKINIQYVRKVIANEATVPDKTLRGASRIVEKHRGNTTADKYEQLFSEAGQEDT